MPSVAVAGNQVVEAVQGPGDTLKVYWASTGSTVWHTTPQVAGKGMALSAPAITEVAGAIDIAVEGPDHSLMLYQTVNGAYHWVTVTISGPVAYSAPSAETVLFNEQYQEHIAVEGPDHSVDLYVFQGTREVYYHVLGGPGTTFSAPSISQWAGDTDLIAVEGPHNSLTLHDGVTYGVPWDTRQLAGPGTTYAAPAIAVPGGADGAWITVVVLGPDNTLKLFWNDLGGQQGSALIAGAGTTYSAPSATAGTYTIDVAATGPGNSLRFYWSLNQASPWHTEFIAGAGTTYSAPSITAEETAAGISAEGPDGQLHIYTASTDS